MHVYLAAACPQWPIISAPLTGEISPFDNAGALTQFPAVDHQCFRDVANNLGQPSRWTLCQNLPPLRAKLCGTA